MRIDSVLLKDFKTGDLRLNAGFYLSEDRQVSEAVKLWHGERICLDEYSNIFRGPIFTRNYIENHIYGEPYVSASDLDRTDYVGCRIISKLHGQLLNELRLHQGMIIITCSGVNLGWGCLVRKDMDGIIGSHDLIRIIPKNPEDLGFLAAYLCSKAGWVMIRSLIYGTSIKHIEPAQVSELSIPWPKVEFRTQIGKGFLDASKKRSESVQLIQEATDFVFKVIGIHDLHPGEWESWGREIGFCVTPSTRTLRAWNYSQKATKVLERLKRVETIHLAEAIKPGTLSKGPSFSRIDAVHPHSVQLIGQRQLFRYMPRGRQISRFYIPEKAYCSPGTTLIASVGTFGESEVYCRAQYVSELTSKWVYSNHILRIVPRYKKISGWLYAFLRSATVFRLLRAMATGSKQQDLHAEMLAELPIPIADDAAYQHVQRLIDKAFKLRDEAFRLEEDAKQQVLNVIVGK